MKLYRVEFFNELSWRPQTMEILANNEGELIPYVDKVCPKSCRNQPYMGNTTPVDSISIIVLQENVSFPYTISDSGEY